MAAFVFVVFSHAAWAFHDLPTAPSQMAFGAVLVAITRPAVPAFLAITGIVIGTQTSGGVEPAYFKQLGRVIVAYATWTAIYLFAYKAIDGTAATAPITLIREFALALLTATGSYHLWYVFVTVQAYLLVPPVATWMSGLRTGGRYLFLAGATAFTIAMLGMVWGPLTGTSSALDAILNRGFDRIIFFWVAYLALGVVIGLDYDSIADQLDRFAPAILAAWAASVVAIAFLVVARVSATDGVFQPALDVSRIVQAWIVPFEMLSVVAWIVLARRPLLQRLSGLCLPLGPLTFAAYLVHALVLHMLRISAYRVWPEIDPMLLVMALTVVVSAGSLGLAWAFSRATMPLAVALGAGSTRGAARRDESDVLSEAAD